MKISLFALGLFIGAFCFGQSNELQQAYTQGIQAYRSGDYKTFYTSMQKAHEIHPYHQGILYQIGIAAALNNKPAEAVGFLKKAVLIQNDFNLDIPDLQSLASRSDFKALMKLQEDYRSPIIHSDTAFVLKDRKLHIEGISTGESKNVFYAASLNERKIVRIENGVASDFISSGQDGIGPVFAVRVDARKKILWAVSSPMPDVEDETSPRSALYKYDLKTHKLLAKYEPRDQSKVYVFGDITLNHKGDVFVSDSKNNYVFKASEADKTLEQFYSSEEFWNIQGITFSDDDQHLFIADYVKGIFSLDTKKMQLAPVSCTLDVSLKGIDGLLYYDHSLIAIQNGVKPLRLTRYALSKDETSIADFTLLEREHPAYNEPTNGALAGDVLYYVANSQWSGYDDNHKIKPDDKLQDIVILKVSLK